MTYLKIEEKILKINDNEICKISFHNLRTNNNKKKVETIFINKIEKIDNNLFTEAFLFFLKSNSLVGNIVVVDPKIYNLEIKELFPNQIIKKIFLLKHDQFLKPSETHENNLYDRSLDIYNNFSKMNKIISWTYRTKKENKKLFKKYQDLGFSIVRTAWSYVVIKGELIIEYGYEDFKDFMRLISKFEKNTLVESYLDLDKRHFLDSGNQKIIGYSNSKETTNIY